MAGMTTDTLGQDAGRYTRSGMVPFRDYMRNEQSTRLRSGNQATMEDMHDTDFSDQAAS
jgi:hypothetical protein